MCSIKAPTHTQALGFLCGYFHDTLKVDGNPLFNCATAKLFFSFFYAPLGPPFRGSNVVLSLGFTSVNLLICRVKLFTCPLSPSLVGLLAKVILVLNIMDRSSFSCASLSSDPALRTQLKARKI